MLASFVVALVFISGALQPDPSGLLFREDWKESPPELPLSQKHVANPGLVLTLYGPGLHGLKKSHHDWIENDPYYVWSGPCPGNWVVTLRPSNKTIDLRGDSKVRWRSKQSGFRQLRLVIKLNSGDWLVSDRSDAASTEWHVDEFRIQDIRWRRLDISRVSEKAWVEHPDLSQVEEIGFSDLMSGGLSDACSRLDWIEVHGAWAP